MDPNMFDGVGRMLAVCAGIVLSVGMAVGWLFHHFVG